MSTKMYVGGLAYETTEEALKEFFAQHGTVTEVTIIMDRDTNRSKGFGFVTMSTPEEATTAIAACNGKDLDGRSLTVNEAKPREERPRRD